MSYDADTFELMYDDRYLPVLRAELKWYPQIYDGQPFWVYKDPLSLKYFRFNREEHFLIQKMKKPVTLDYLKAEHQREFNSGEVSNQELGQFVSGLMSKNLLMLKQADRDELMYTASRNAWKRKMKGMFSNFMFLKIPLIDPNKMLDKLMPKISFVWTKSFFIIYLIMMMIAGTLVISRWADFESMFRTSFFTLYNVPILFAAFWLVKALHEFGHGLTCKAYGGEVHEIGFLFLVFAPFLYCNVTDSWTFPSKASRLLVTAAGIMTEFMLASIAAVIWYYTSQPGFIHAFMFNIIIVCSISTVMFNANPLLKYDGYYMLMDLIEVPNLRQRSSEYMKGLFIKYFLGGEAVETSEEHRFRFVFPLYSLSAFVYRWFIMFVIVFSVYGLLKQLHLTWLGRGFVVFSVMTMMVLPVYKTGEIIVKQRHAMGVSKVRLLVILAAIITFAGVGLFWPLQQHVTLNFILEPTELQWLRAGVDGRVDWAEGVKEGQWVSADSPLLARLSNEELKLEKVKLDSQIAQVEIQISQWQNRGDMNQVDQLKKRYAVLMKEKDRLDTHIASLELKAPFEGEILTPDRKIKEMQGQFVVRSMPMLLLADTRKMAAKVWVPEKTYARIFKQDGSLDQKAELMLYSFAGEEFGGKVSAVSLHREDNMGEFNEKLALSNKVGGEVITEFDPEVGREKPIDAVYEVTIDLDDETMEEIANSVRPYMSGRVRIDCGKYTLYQWGRDSLLRFISPEVRL